MSVATNLIPSRQKHSVTEAVLSFFLAQPIIKPNRFSELLIEGQPFHGRFHQFQLEHEFQLSAKIESPSQSEVKSNFESGGLRENGFTMQSFKDGKIEYILKYFSTGGNQMLSIHILQYNRWSNFINDAKFFLSSIANFQSNMFVKTIALTYIDQFNWVDKEQLPLEKIFRNDSKYLPMIVLDSIGDWNYVFGHTINGTDKPIYEQINLVTNSIAINNTLITLSHNVAKGFSDSEVELSADNIVNIFCTDADYLHSLNKVFFKSCLNDEILSLVNIN